MLDYERRAWASGFRRVAGVDEAGRGPLAGPVIAAAVVFDPEFVEAEVEGKLRGLTDSKRLTLRRREIFFDLLSGCDKAEIGIGQATVPEIDELNILRATHLAMKRALEALPGIPDFALVDGLPVDGLPCPSQAVPHGDALILSVAAASVIAKVTRDRLMKELDKQFPGYGFAQHKGYGTRKHLAALAERGPCVCHRRTFAPVAQLPLSVS